MQIACPTRFPQKYRYIPINGDPHISDNGVPMSQYWSTFRNFDDIIEANGKFRKLDDMADDRRPLECEYKELKKTLTDFLDIYSGGRLGANICKLGITVDTNRSYNIYGRLITKRIKDTFVSMVG